jgi:FAD/FMN-containing dehydrogenase
MTFVSPGIAMSVRSSNLSQRLEQWAKARHNDGGAAKLDNLQMRDAAKSLGVSFQEVRDARDALVTGSAGQAEQAGSDFGAELEQSRDVGPSFGARSAARSPALQGAGVGEVSRMGGVQPPHSESLEQVSAELENLVDAETHTSALRRPWDRQSETEQGQLAALGFDAASWDAVRGGALDKLPEAMTKSFDELSSAQQGAAKALGYDAALWNGDVAARADILDNKDILGAFTSLLQGEGPLTTADVEDKLLPEVRDWGVATPSEKRALLYLLDFHGHRFTMDGRRAIRDDVLKHTRTDQIAGGFGKLENSSDTVVNDASGLEMTTVRQLVKVTSPEDVRRAIGTAKATGAQVSVAGRRHSEGGHSVAPASINLDMLSMNRMELLDNGNLRVEAGATWAQVQDELAKHGKSPIIQQSANIFSVGGSIAVNCHGRTPGEPPLNSTIESMRVMNAEGEVVTCSRDENPELFEHAIGGYGLFGVILDVELKVRENTHCKMEVEVTSTAEYVQKFKEAKDDPDVQLAWGRINPGDLDEMIIHRVVSTGEDAEAGVDNDGVGFESGGSKALTKAVFHASKVHPQALEARWALEKKMRMGKEPEATLTQFSSPNVEFLNQYWFNEGRTTDILHEYYVPPESFDAFAKGLKKLQEKHGQHTLNCTIRDVGKDDESALTYAKKDMFAFVLYYPQSMDEDGVKAQAALTKDIIDLSIECGGTFYLPYQRHYSKEQLKAGYPEIDTFFAKKREMDPDGMFTNKWYQTYGVMSGDAEGAPGRKREDDTKQARTS